MSALTSLTRSWLTHSFRPFEFDAHADGRLSWRDADRLGLYVHIPFCRSLCPFCPYCKVLYDENLADRFVEALLSEIDMVASMDKGPKKTVTSLYFGGGTPALLDRHIDRIIARLKRHFDITEGIGLELHPCDVTVEKLERLRQAGVTKISIGIQSFQDDFLDLLERGSFDRDSMFAALKAVPFETVSMDFIFALPGQTLASVCSDIELAFSNGANHVALYPFIDFTYTRGDFPRMREAEKKQLLFDIVAYCENRGYTRDSIWTFSKDGRSRYSSMTRENFLGFGCSATTLLKDRFSINTFSPTAYIECIENRILPTALTLHFSERQRMVYYLFWTAYSLRVDPREFHRFFGKDLNKAFGLELGLARLLGFATLDDGRYTMTTKGSYYYHYYENFYTLSYIDRMWSLMGETPFPDGMVIR